MSGQLRTCPSLNVTGNSRPVNFRVSSTFFLSLRSSRPSRIILVTSDEVEKMLKSLNSKKAAGTDRLPIKLVKLDSEVLSKTLSIVMNNSTTLPTFLDREKVATVVPIDKKNDNKYTVSNFRPVSLLNCFSKIPENYINNHIVNSMSSKRNGKRFNNRGYLLFFLIGIFLNHLWMIPNILKWQDCKSFTKVVLSQTHLRSKGVFKN